MNVSEISRDIYLAKKQINFVFEKITYLLGKSNNYADYLIFSNSIKKDLNDFNEDVQKIIKNIELKYKDEVIQ